MKKIKQFLALLLIILSVAVYALYPKGANAHAEQNKITAGQDNNITAGKDKIATVQISNPSVAAASSVQNIACSDNGTPGTSTDDSVSFEVSTTFFSDYSITATFAGSSVPITLMDGTSATNLMGGVVQHFKIMNGALGTGNFTLTITPVTGTPETLTFANPGTCSTVCTSASTGNTVSYVYDSQYFRGDIQGEAFSLPKFDEGTNRKLTKVTVEYGSRVYGSTLLEHTGSGINEGKYRIQSKYYGDIAFLGFTNSNAGDIISQSPGYPALATIPAAVNIPAQGSWPGDVTSALGSSTMSRMLIFPDNTWLDNYLSRGVNPNTSPNWVTNITGNASHDDDIVFLPIQSNAYIQPALTYTLQADLNKFIGTGAFNGTYDATTSMSSNGPINLSMAMINNLYAKVTYTYDCIAPPANYCVSGCNGNAYVNSSDPNTIEYDNMVSVFHSSMVKEFDGKIKVWGQGIASTGSGTSGNVTALQEINVANYPGLTGDVLKFAAGSNLNVQQFAVLTTTGLFVWGNSGIMVPLDNPTNNVLTGNFRKAAVGTYNVSSGATKADGLPAGVSPTDVKMMFGTRDGLAIVTCTGAAWVLSSNNNTYGDGAIDDAANDIVWHRVSTATDTPLNNVVAVRGTHNTMMALTSTGAIYTWGKGTRINSGAAIDRPFATLIAKPAGVTPKMIGMTGSNDGKTYYLLSTTGELYAMGENNVGQLGNSSTTDSDTWVLVNGATSTVDGITYTLGNIVWISPQEHDGHTNTNYAAINVLTNTGKLWAWGSNNYGMLGGGSTNATINPTYMPGSIIGAYDAGKLNLDDKLTALETGGHTTLTIKQCTTKFGYVGHKVRGSMANNDAEDQEQTYNFSDTAELAICGAVTAPIVKDLKICEGTTANLADAVSAALPSGVTGITWWRDAAATADQVTNPAAVGPGVYYAVYEGLGVRCPTKMTVSYFVPTDPEYSTCACYNPAYTPGTGPDTKLGITLLKRAGAGNADNWPMVRKSGHIALESNTKGFVVTRIAKADLGNITSPQEGMMVYDTTDKCLKIYADGVWACFSNPACP